MPFRAAADAASARWKSGSPLSRIDGMPVGIKDIIETAQFPTQMGSPLFDGWHSHRDAASVAALRQAGAIVLGKTVTTEFAATHPRGTRNPWDLARTPGGSSSGSAAAVASGMVSAALGTNAADTRTLRLQSDLLNAIVDSTNQGLGAVVDADVGKASASAQSRQVQQQLAIQQLSIANQQPQLILGIVR